jgi:hypothetical protein
MFTSPINRLRTVSNNCRNFSKSTPCRSLDFFNGREEVIDSVDFIGLFAASVLAPTLGVPATKLLGLAFLCLVTGDFGAGVSLEELPLLLFATVLLWRDFSALADLPPLTTVDCLTEVFFPLLLLGKFFKAPRTAEEVLVEPTAAFLGLALALVNLLLLADLSPVDFELIPLGLVGFWDEVFFLTADDLEAGDLAGGDLLAEGFAVLVGRFLELKGIHPVNLGGLLGEGGKVDKCVKLTIHQFK